MISMNNYTEHNCDICGQVAYSFPEKKFFKGDGRKSHYCVECRGESDSLLYWSATWVGHIQNEPIGGNVEVRGETISEALKLAHDTLSMQIKDQYTITDIQLVRGK
jgi:hypothetical protein